MGEARAQAVSAETRERLATASATGRMLLGMLTAWVDREAGPAITAANADLRGLSDRDANAVWRALRRGGTPDDLADAMVTVLDALSHVDGLTAAERRTVRRLAGGWLPAAPSSR